MKSNDTASTAHWEHAYQELLANLTTTSTNTPALQYCPPCVNLCVQQMKILKQQLTQLVFPSEALEIHFFKSVKPRFHAQLIYYSKIWEIELKRPAGDRRHLEKYYLKHLKKIHLFSNYHADIYQYHRIGATYLDKEYFTRNGTPPLSFQHYKRIDADPAFSTSKDYLISQIIAGDLLSAYLQHAITQMDDPLPLVNQADTKRRLMWKGPKIGLIEFGYACKEANMLEEPLHEIFECFESSFSIELKNTSRTFQEILSRKKEETVMDKLARKLKERIDKMLQGYKPSK